MPEPSLDKIRQQLQDPHPDNIRIPAVRTQGTLTLELEGRRTLISQRFIVPRPYRTKISELGSKRHIRPTTTTHDSP